MKKDLITFLCFMVLVSIDCLWLCAEQTINKDSLMNTLKRLPEKERLQTLDSLAQNHSQTNKCRVYIDLLFQEAAKAKSRYYKENACFYIGQYYYLKDIDSVNCYTKIAEPLFIADNRKDELFRMKSWSIFMMSSAGKGTQALALVNAMRKQAKALNFPDGLDVADVSLADIYFRTGLEKEGIRLCEGLLSKMEARKALLIKRINVLRLLLTHTNNIQKRKSYLGIMLRYINEMERNGLKGWNNSLTVDYLKFTYHKTWANIESGEKNAEKMLFHIQEAMKYIKDNDEPTILLLWIDYYELVNDHAKALLLTDKLLASLKQSRRTKDYTVVLQRKSNILYDSGRIKDAMDVYRVYTAIKDSITSAKYYSDLAELREQHDMDQLEISNKLMELKSVKDNSHIRILELSLLLLVVVTIAALLIALQRSRISRIEKRARAKAEEADRLKSTFLANMNHEIRTPLNAIVGFSQVLVEEDSAEVRKEYLGVIQRNNDLLQQLIADVLDLSKIESNTMTFSYREVDLPKLMNDIYSSTLLRMPETVQLELAPCEAMMFITDRNRLTQIITNLLNNSIKHTAKGFIRFGYNINSTTIHFFIQDTGEGIPEDKLETIFVRFVQLDEMSKGVGLGLAICKGLTSQMKGSIGVTSKLGEGSCFSVDFPIKHDIKE